MSHLISLAPFAPANRSPNHFAFSAIVGRPTASTGKRMRKICRKTVVYG